MEGLTCVDGAQADGDIAACGSPDNTVHVWRRSSGLDSMMSGYPGKPSALEFDHTGTLLAKGGANSVLVWSFAGDGPEGMSPGVLELHVHPLTTLALASRRRRLASGALDGGVCVCDVEHDSSGGAVLRGKPIAGLAWRPDGRALMALDADCTVSVWRTGR